MYRHGRNDGRIDRTMFVPLLRGGLPLHRKSFHLIQHVPTVQDFPKHRVNVVQMWLPFVCYEKLRSVGIHSRIGHAHLSPLVVDIVRVKFVLEFPSPYRFAALASPGRISSLNHESFDVSMECGPVVITAGAQGEEIERRSLRRVAEDLDFYIAKAGVEGDRHDERQSLTHQLDVWAQM